MLKIGTCFWNQKQIRGHSLERNQIRQNLRFNLWSILRARVLWDRGGRRELPRRAASKKFGPLPAPASQPDALSSRAFALVWDLCEARQAARAVENPVCWRWVQRGEIDRSPARSDKNQYEDKLVHEEREREKKSLRGSCSKVFEAVG